MWLVELDRHVPAQQSLRRLGNGLPQRISAMDHWEYKMGGSLPGPLPSRLYERTRHPDRGLVFCSLTGSCIHSGRVALRRLAIPSASQPIDSDGPDRPTFRRRIWPRPRTRHVELCWLRAAFQHDRRNEKSAENFRAHPRMEHADEYP